MYRNLSEMDELEEKTIITTSEGLNTDVLSWQAGPAWDKPQYTFVPCIDLPDKEVGGTIYRGGRVKPGFWVEVYHLYDGKRQNAFGVVCDMRHIPKKHTDGECAMVVMWTKKIGQPDGTGFFAEHGLSKGDFVLQSWGSIVSEKAINGVLEDSIDTPVVVLDKLTNDKGGREKRVKLCSNIWYDRKERVYKLGRLHLDPDVFGVTGNHLSPAQDNVVAKLSGNQQSAPRTPILHGNAVPTALSDDVAAYEGEVDSDDEQEQAQQSTDEYGQERPFYEPHDSDTATSEDTDSDTGGSNTSASEYGDADIEDCDELDTEAEDIMESDGDDVQASCKQTSTSTKKRKRAAGKAPILRPKKSDYHHRIADDFGNSDDSEDSVSKQSSGKKLCRKTTVRSKRAADRSSISKGQPPSQCSNGRPGRNRTASVASRTSSAPPPPYSSFALPTRLHGQPGHTAWNQHQQHQHHQEDQDHPKRTPSESPGIRENLVSSTGLQRGTGPASPDLFGSDHLESSHQTSNNDEPRRDGNGSDGTTQIQRHIPRGITTELAHRGLVLNFNGAEAGRGLVINLNVDGRAVDSRAVDGRAVDEAGRAIRRI